MKFPQLPIGARFRWQGELYRKAGPMTADAVHGTGQRLIPRSATVEPAEDSAGGPPTTDPSLSAAEVRAALDTLTASLYGYAENLDGPERSALEARVDEATQAFRTELRL